MIQFLASIFIKNRQDYSSPAVRQAYGTLCGAVGIGLNILLFLGKWMAGFLSGSIAITADAFNNLSDAGSSIITLIGFRISGQRPDPEHPFGHGRMEYISGLLVSVAILVMGFELVKSSIEKLIHPEPVESSPVIIGILAVSILVKVYMFYYNRAVGKKNRKRCNESDCNGQFKRHRFHSPCSGGYGDQPVYRTSSGWMVWYSGGTVYSVYRGLYHKGNHGSSSGAAAKGRIY